MTQSRLPFPEAELLPADHLIEPDIWVRRIIFIENPVLPLKIIRRISFRRGLNIVDTETRNESDTKPVGHSVGKSLLVRIIRYCLGEERFCTPSLRAAIAAQYERGYVIALIRVKGEDWSVARPIGLETGYGDSWCRKTKRLRDAVNPDDRLRYRDFVDAIEAATSACYADIPLPRADRKAGWRDLLGWLSRDQDCHFDHHAEWRTPETQAGPRALTREDAYLVMRMALGLLGPEEIGLLEKHRSLLDSKAAADGRQKQLAAFVEQAETRLRDAVGELKDQPSGAVFGAAFASIADGKIESLQSLLADPSVINADELTAMRESLDEQLRSEGSIQARLEGLRMKQVSLDAELKNARNSESGTLLIQLNSMRWRCNYNLSRDEAHSAGCPGKDLAKPGSADPWIKQRIAELEQEMAAAGTAIDEGQEELAEAKKQSDVTRRRLTTRTSEIERVRGDIERKSGVWEARKGEADRYSAVWSELEKLETRQGSAQKKIDQSAESLRTARSRFDRIKGELSEHYNTVLKRIISPAAEGSIEIDGDGIRPISNEAVADSGTTLREYADVLSFDLSCLAASVCGVGQLPRLWIHDSPRQADSEEELYHSILRFVADLEAKFPSGRKPSFQYILTTTSVPAPEVNRPPYTRCRLHAREEAGRLLKRDFGK